MRLLCSLLLLPGLVAPVGAAQAPSGGAACVMAKWRGNTLDYALAYGKSHPVEAQEQAEQLLRERGYGEFKHHVDVLHPQALTNLPHAYAVVIRSRFNTRSGTERTSFGCGFSPASYQDALWEAVRDLQSYSWGWKPDRDGYELVQKLRY